MKDIASVDWIKERDNFNKKVLTSDTHSDSGNRSPSFSSLMSVNEDTFFDKFELNEGKDVVGKNMPKKRLTCR